MKFKITPEQLAHQLPDIADEILSLYKKEFILSGRFHKEERDEIGSREERYPVLKDHPEFVSHFTAKQLEVISFFWGQERTAQDLEYFMYDENIVYDGGCVGNKGHVHMYNVRKILIQNELDFEFKKQRIDRQIFYTFANKK